MERISLYGRKEAIVGWRRLLDQEKVPYKYKGDNLENFSDLNIIVDCDTSVVNLPSNRVFIIEPGFDERVQPIEIFNYKKGDGRKSNKKETNLITKKDKTYLFHQNVSKLLAVPFFDFRDIPELSTDESQIQLYTAAADREKASRFLRQILIDGHHLLGVPYIHLWYYPSDQPSIFIFRQDVDYVDPEGVQALTRVTKDFGVRGTYFINMSGEEEVEDEIGHLKLDKSITIERKELLLPLLSQGNEFANHGYWHWVFDDYEQNVQNIQRCNNDLLKEFNIKVLICLQLSNFKFSDWRLKLETLVLHLLNLSNKIFGILELIIFLIKLAEMFCNLRFLTCFMYLLK